MKIGIVLNFNNYQQTMECAQRLLKSGMDQIVVVDNASSNNSYRLLLDEFESNQQVNVILSKQNCGYATGNNIGLLFAEKHFTDWKSNVIFIVNPDSSISQKGLEQLADVALNTPNAGAVTGLINGTNKSVWHHMTPMTSFIFNSWILKWCLIKMNHREGGFYKIAQESIQNVDVVMGALFAIKQSTFRDIGYFDTGTFLYYEEEGLAVKLAQKHYQSLLVNNVNFEHIGRGSTTLNKVSFKKINDASRLYILKKYYGVGKVYSNVTLMVNRIDNVILKVMKR